MRRVRIDNNRSNNPAILFAAGFESIVSDQLSNPSKYDEEEHRAIKRKAYKKAHHSSLFSVLCRQLFWRQNRLS